MRFPTATAAEQAGGSHILFRFTYRSMPCRVAASKAAVTLQADIGIMPFTGDGPSLRQSMVAVLDQARRLPGYSVQRTAGQGIGLTIALAVEDGAPPASILATAIRRLAEAKPLLDTVLSLLPKHLRHRADSSRDAAYRMAGSGTANTCPG